MKTVRTRHIVLGVSASVAVYKACDLVRRIRERGWTVSVVMTADAQQLIKPVLFEALSGEKVHTDMFAAVKEWEIGHVSLAKRADCLLIAPATANIIAKLASGECDDLLTCVACATKAPVVICPAMNENMYTHPVTQRNIKTLRGIGYRFVEPAKGRLACGDVGVGCLADSAAILRAVDKIFG